MCLAVPMQVTKLLPDEMAMVEADGVRRQVNLMLLPEVVVGEYVIVHAGYAIERLDEEEAQGRLALLAELVNAHG